MSISATSNTYVPVYPPLSPSKSSAPPGNPPLPAGIDRVKHATEMAIGYAGNAELYTSQINQSIDSYNNNGGENLEKRIDKIKEDKKLIAQRLAQLSETDDPAFNPASIDTIMLNHERQRLLAQYQAYDGKDWETTIRDTAKIRRDADKRGIEGADHILRMSLNVSGATYTYDPKTDTYARGAFTASVDLGDSAVRFDSRKGPEVSIMGTAFTTNFARNSIPQMGSLDYEVINPDELAAIQRHEDLMRDWEQLNSMSANERHDALMKVKRNRQDQQKLLDLKV